MMRAGAVVLLLMLSGCEALWGSFRGTNDIACTLSSDCTADATLPVCVGGLCKPCDTLAPTQADAECAGRKAIQGSNVCVRSGANQGKCQPCNLANDCGADESLFCTAANQCTSQGCTDHASCRSNVCDVYAGQCLASTNVVYVDNNAGAGCSDAATGGKTTPVCTLAKALTLAVGSRNSIRVAASAVDYSGGANLSVKSSVNLYGPAGGPAGTDDTARARIGAGTSIAVDVNSGVQVTIDGMDLNAAGSGATAILCQGGSTVHLRRSRMIGFSEVGLNSLGCTVDVDRTLFSNQKKSGALWLQMGTGYTITNSVITGFTSTVGAAVVIATGSSGKFYYNTVTNNNAIIAGNTAAGAIQCPAVAQDIQNSIFFANTQVPDNGTGKPGQLFACTVVNSVVGPGDNTPGGITQDPKLVSATSDPHLTPASTACLAKGIAPAAAIPNLSHAFEGNPRPQGRADIGAYQLTQ